MTTDILRYPTDPSTILTAIVNRMIQVLPSANGNVIYNSLNVDEILLIPNQPWYATLTERNMRLRNNETLDPTDLFDINVPTAPQAAPEIEMQVLVQLWLWSGLTQAMRLDGQLTGAYGLYTYVLDVIAALDMYDLQDSDGDNILCQPLRFNSKNQTIINPKQPSTYSKYVRDGVYWLRSDITFDVRFQYDFSPALGGAYSSAYSSAFNTLFA